MNNLDKEYQILLEYIIGNGYEKKDRTGVGTLSIFGWQIRHKMSEGFPLLTTKKMYWKGIVTELLWFLRGDTNIKYLVDNNCHIWDGDAYKKYKKEWSKYVPGDGSFKESEYNTSKPHEAIPYTKEEFIEKIKTDDEFAKKWGELGPIYGKQWRSWKIIYDNNVSEWVGEGEDAMPIYKVLNRHDQISNLIEQLKTNPDSRRLMVSAWNVGELDQMTLPPCHYGFQVYTRELSENERYVKLVELTNRPLFFLDNGDGKAKMKEFMKECDKLNIPNRAISLMWNQRSVDTFLGLPFNIASYGLLLGIIAKEVNMVPDELIGNLGDVHLYKNHIEQAEEQIGRELSMEERSNMYKDKHNIPREVVLPFVRRGGHNLDEITKHTREPMKLPTLNINTEHWDRPLLDLIKSEYFCKCLLEEDIQLANYESHPTIKAPLNN
jgi:thymidylate synthase